MNFSLFRGIPFAVSVVSECFKVSTEVCSFWVHAHLMPLWVNFRRGAARVAKFWINRPQYCIMPRNICRDWCVLHWCVPEGVSLLAHS